MRTDIKTFYLDANNFSNLQQFYDEVEKVLTKDLPHKIGRNLDAFDEALRGDFGAFEFDEPILLIWKRSEKSKKDLSWKETVLYFENKLKHCHPGNKQSVKEELCIAQDGKGETLFDLIFGIIREHKHITLILE